MWKKIRYWLHRDSRRMHCRAFCGRCPYFEQCRCDELRKSRLWATMRRETDDIIGNEEEKMSEKWQLNITTAALAIGIILVWITWDPGVVICCMVLSVLRLGSLFWEYPEMLSQDIDECETEKVCKLK